MHRNPSLSRPDRLKRPAVRQDVNVAAWSTIPGHWRQLRVAIAIAALARGVGLPVWAADPASHALPTKGQIAAGQAAIASEVGRMNVTQSSNAAVINWESFNIGSSAHVNFAQPSASSVILNRVVGGDGSAIFGRLTANGNVFISNPGGIIFAPGAQVDVGGLVASSLGISNPAFMAGNYQFDRTVGGSKVANQGVIRAADGGFVALIAPQVSNSGTIIANRGSVGLAAADSVKLDFDHDGLLTFKVDVGAAAARADNSGIIATDGGRVVMNAQGKDALLSTVLNNDGIVRARGLESRRGEIWLGGGNSGVVSVSGILDASVAATGQKGGEIKVLGEKVALVGTANLNVSGVGGGGTVLVGGNWQGKGPEPNSVATYVAKDAKINADAVETGNGGKVVVWADRLTTFLGGIFSRGGARSGNGGSVEVSGKDALAFSGSFDAKAPNGKPGSLLLDPTEITIQQGAANNNISGGPTFTSTGAGSSIKWSTLDAALSGGTVTVQTSSNDIVVADGYDFSADNTVAGGQNNAATGTLKLLSAANIGATGGLTVTGRAGLNLWLSATGTTNIDTNLASFGDVKFENGASSTYSGVISGTGGLTKAGTSTLTLSGANTYTGTTNVTAGTLSVTAANALHTGSALVVNGGTLDINNVTLNTLASASVQGTGQGGVGAITGTGAGAQYDGAITLAGATTVGAATGGGTDILTLNGVLSGGAVALTKVGAGTLVLGGANSYTGGTTVNGGTLKLGAGGVLADTGAVSLANTAGVVFDVNGQTETIGTLTGGAAAGVSLGAGTLTVTQGANAAVDGVISGTGGLTKAGTSTLTLSGANTYTGTTNVTAGTLSVTAANALHTGSALVVNGGTLDINNVTLNTLASASVQGTGQGGVGAITGTGAGAQYDGAITLAGATTVGAATGGGTDILTLNGVLSGGAVALTKVGAGTLVLGGANSYTGGTTVNGGTLKLGAGGVLADTGAVSLANTAGVVFDVNGQTETIGTLTGGAAAGVSLGAGTLTVTQGANAAVDGVISGTGGLTKAGTSTLTLSGANTYTGTTNVTAGTLSVTAANALHTGSALVVNGGTLDINNVTLNTLASASVQGTGQGGVGAITGTGAGAQYDGAITLAGATTVGAATGGGTDILTLNGVLSGGAVALTKVGAGTLVLGGANSYTGGTTVNGGTLKLGAGGVLADTGAVSLANTAGVVFDVNGQTETIGTLTGGAAAGISLGAGTLTVTQGANAAVDGVISGTGGLTKAGTSTLTLSGANTYTGTTNVTAGTLSVTAANALHTGSALVVNGGTLDINNVTLNTLASASVQGTGQGGVGAITGTGAGAQYDGAITLAGATTVGAATGGGTDILTLNGVLSGGAVALTKVGAGTLVLGGANTYTGTTNVTAGTLSVTAANALHTGSALVVNGGTLDINNVTLNTLASASVQGTGQGGVGAITGTGAGAQYDGAITLAGATTVGAATGGGTDILTLNGVLSGGAVALTKVGAGTLVLGGANSYTGGTTVNGGTLKLGAGGVLADTGAVSLANTAGVVFDVNGQTETIGTLTGGAAAGVSLGAGTLTVTQGANAAVDGVISGTGGLTKAGTSTLTLSGANTYTGTTNVTAGTLSVTAANALHTGSALVVNGGTLDINNVTLNTLASASVQGTGQGGVGAITGTGAGAQYDGAITLAGATTVGAATGGGTDILTLNGVLSGGAVALTKVGAGTLVLGGANSYTGGTTVNGGTLKLGAGGVLADTGAVSLANTAGVVFDVNGQTETIGTLTGGAAAGISLGAGTLTVTQGANAAVDGVISGTGGLTKAGTSTLTLSGANTYTGTTNVTAGTLSVTAANALHTGSALVVNGGTLDINNVTLNTLASASVQGTGQGGVGAITGTGAGAQYDGAITLAGATTVGAATGGGTDILTLNGVLSGGAVALTKVGAGTLVLGGANSYTGGTTVNGGTLKLGAGGVLADTGAVSLANTAGVVFDVNGQTETIGTLTGGAAAGVSLGAGTLTVTQGANAAVDGVISGTGGLTKAGTSTLTLSGANTYTGTTNVTAGTLSVTAANALHTGSALVVNGGTLDINNVTLNTLASASVQGTGQGGVGAITGTGAGAQYDGAITLAGATTVGAATGGGTDILTLNGVLSGGAVALTKVGAGTLVLGGANSYTGGTTVNGGTLKLGAGGVLADTGAVSLANTAGVVFDVNGQTETIGTLTGGAAAGISLGAGTLTVTQGANAAVDGVISGTGGLTKAGTSTLTLSGANTYTGTTNVTAGTLAVTVDGALGSSAAGTTVANGATLDLQNVSYASSEALTLQSGGTLAASTGTSAFGGNVTLVAPTASISVGGGLLRLDGTVNGAAATTASGSGTLEFVGSVGSSTPLGSMVVAAGLTAKVSTAGVTTSGGQSYNGNVILGADASLSGAGISFAGTVRSDGTTRSLTLADSGTTTFGGAVGSAVAGEKLTSLTTNAGGTTAINGGAVSTTGAQTYNDAVTLGAATTLTGVGNTFATTIDGAQTLAINDSGTTTLGGAVGNGTALTSLTTNAGGTTAINGGIVKTTGAQTYNDAVTLGAATTLTGVGNTFATTIDGAQTLAINDSGTTTLGGAVGNGTALTSLTTNAGGTTAINGGIVKTTGAQTYNDAVTLGAATTLTGVGNTFATTIDGAQTLAINDSGTTTLGGAVGNGTALTSLTTNAGGTTAINGGIVKTTGAQTYNDAVTLGAATTLTGVGNTFATTIDGAQTLAINDSGTTTLGGAVGNGTALTSLTTNAGGTTAINGGIVKTTGAQTYNDAVTLGAATTLTGVGNTFATTIDGAQTLAINDSGTTTLGGAVGNGTALTSLTTNAGGTTAINGGAVSTTGAQTYNDAVTLGAATTLTGVGNTFATTIDGAQTLAINDSGTTTLGGAVGNGTALTSLTTNAGGTTAINGGIVKTTGAQTYNDAVTLGAATTLTGVGNTFATTIDGAQTLAINDSGTTTLGGAVGNGTALTSLTTNAGGTTAINGGIVKTTGAQTYNDAVTLGAATTLTGVGNTFATTIDGAQTLAINDSGTTTLGGAVGNGTALTSLTTNAGGTTAINGGIVKTTGAQTYNDAVTLGAATTLTGVGNTFATTIDGAQTLAINDSGTTTLGGAVGNGTALTSLTTNAGGTTAINGGIVKTTGAQTYNDAVTLGAATTLTGVGNTFATTIDGAQTLAINDSGTTTLGGAVGNGTALTSLTTNAGGTTAINGGIVKTTGAQTYNDAVTLGAATTLTGVGNTFATTIDGAQTLAINDSGTTTLGGAVGNGTALTSLTTNAGGTTAINGGAVSTTGAQTYNDAVTLGAATTLTGVGNTFATTIDGAQTLAINDSGTTTLGGAVGNGTALTSLTTNAGGTTAINGGIVKTTGAQTYNDAVTLGAATTLTGVGNTFATTIDGAQTLAINDSGTTTLGGAVGNGTALTSLTTNAGGTTAINGGIVKTTGAQTYNDAVTLGAATTLTGVGNTFATTIDGAQTLAINDSGTTTLGGAVGNGTALTSLTTNAGGTTAINGGIVKTTGAQTYNDAVTLGAATTLTGVGNTFATTIDGAQTLAINDSGTTTLGGAVGNGTALTSLTTNAGGTTAINGGIVKTTGAQTYNDAVTLGADLTASAGIGTIRFSNTVDGPFSLDVNTSGVTSFAGTIGGVRPLASVITDSSGTTSISAARILTTGAQTYNDPITSISLTLSSGTGAVVAGNSGNDFGALSVVGKRIHISDVNDISLVISDSGDSLVQTGGSLGLSGTVLGNLVATSGGATSFGAITVGGFVDLTASGAISQTGLLSVSGDLWARSLSGNILFNGFRNLLGGSVSLIAPVSNRVLGAGSEIFLNADSIRVGSVRPSDRTTTIVGIQAARVTIEAPNGAAIQADGTQGLITADAPLSSKAALTIIANGVIGNPATSSPTKEGLQVNVSGLVEVVGNALADGTVMLVGDNSIQPKYEFSGDPTHRSVRYNGSEATNAQLTGALDAAYLDIRNQTTETRESGFAKENASKIVRRGTITTAGSGQTAVDDSSGMAKVDDCEGVVVNRGLSCR